MATKVGTLDARLHRECVAVDTHCDALGSISPTSLQEGSPDGRPSPKEPAAVGGPAPHNCPRKTGCRFGPGEAARGPRVAKGVRPGLRRHPVGRLLPVDLRPKPPGTPVPREGWLVTPDQVAVLISGRVRRSLWTEESGGDALEGANQRQRAGYRGHKPCPGHRQRLPEGGVEGLQGCARMRTPDAGQQRRRAW